MNKGDIIQKIQSIYVNEKAGSTQAGVGYQSHPVNRAFGRFQRQLVRFLPSEVDDNG